MAESAAADAVDRIRAELTGPGGEFELVRDGSVARFVHRQRSLTHWVRKSAALGRRECLVQGGRRIDFAGHAAAVAGVAALLRAEYGVRAGDRVAILAANSPDWIVTFWAAASLGAVVAAGNAWWSPGEAADALDLAEPSLVVADERRLALAGGRPRLDLADVITIVDNAADLPAVELPDAEPDTDAPAVIVYTSGTTGRAKGAVHTHANLLSVIEYHRFTDRLGELVAAELGRLLPVRPRRFLMSLPLFHIASLHNLALPRLASGDTVVLDEGRFDADRVLELVARERITNWAVVPTMAHRVVAAAARGLRDLSSLTAMSINSAPSTPELKAEVRAAVPGAAASLADSYGLTEAGTAATVATAADLAAEPTSVGRPIPGVEVSIRDEAGRPVPDGAEGEIWIRSPYVMCGYWRDSQASAAALDAERWLHSGDLGRRVDGRLHLAARRSDLILRGGENVYPAEVEAVLGSYPAVRECAVVGVPDDDLGERVGAVVVSDDSIDPAGLEAYAGARLAHYKVPVVWRVTADPLPRTATGKVRRGAVSLVSPHYGRLD